MVSRQQMVERVTTLMDRPEYIRNIGIVAHIDHGKTTLSDNLLAGAGMISKELAGTQLFMDFDEEEQARGITINAANVSMVHEFHGKEYLINLIDTPGHVDFGGTSHVQCELLTVQSWWSMPLRGRWLKRKLSYGKHSKKTSSQSSSYTKSTGS